MVDWCVLNVRHPATGYYVHKSTRDDSHRLESDLVGLGRGESETLWAMRSYDPLGFWFNYAEGFKQVNARQWHSLANSIPLMCS